VRVHRAQLTRVKATLTRGGRRVKGATVRLRGPGFNRHAKTSASGRVLFKVRPRRSGRATVSSGGCGGKLRVSASRVRRPSAGPDFTG
jgi:hypothetical protein